jgi:hypothetical protein
VSELHFQPGNPEMKQEIRNELEWDSRGVMRVTPLFESKSGKPAQAGFPPFSLPRSSRYKRTEPCMNAELCSWNCFRC